MMRFDRLKIGWLICGALPLLGTEGCRYIPLYQDPTVHEVSSRPPLALYTVEWWLPLVRRGSWEYLPREVASPAADPETGRVIVLTRDGTVRAISESGQLEWTFQTEGHFAVGARVQQGMAYVPGGDGFLYALHADSGELAWKYDAGEELVTQPLLASGNILVCTVNDILLAIDAASGKQRWRYRRESVTGFTVRGASTPKVHQGVAYVGFSDGYLVAVSLEDGSVKWQRALSTPAKQFMDVDTSPVLDSEGRLFAASYKDGIYALDADNGSIQWHTARAGVTSLLLRGPVLFAAGDQEVGALHEETGRPVWSLNLGSRAAQAPVLAAGLLVVPTAGPLIFVDPATGRPRSYWNPGKGVSATPLWNRSRLFVLSNLGYLYAMRLHGRGG
jgi:outer membrane protein assembly factor BamB